MNRFSIAALRVLISVFPLVLAACMHAPVDVPSNAAPPAFDEPAQPINQHGGTEEYGEREISIDFNQATLNPQAVSKLDEAAESLKKYPDLIVEVLVTRTRRKNTINSFPFVERVRLMSTCSAKVSTFVRCSALWVMARVSRSM